MKSNYDYEEKDDKIAISDIIACMVLILFLIFFLTTIVVKPVISSMQVKNLSKDPKNIKDNGCLLYSTKRGKHGEDMFIFNQRGPYTMRQIAIKDFPFKKNFNQLRKESNISYDEFKKIHTKECIKVRYIEHKVLWAFATDIYDLQ